MIKPFFLFFFLCLSSSPLLCMETQEEPSHIFALLIQGQSSEESKACHEADIARMKMTITTIGQLLHKEVTLIELKDKEVTLKQINASLKALFDKSSGEKDWNKMCIIYYSGGFGKTLDPKIHEHDAQFYPTIRYYEEGITLEEKYNEGESSIMYGISDPFSFYNTRMMLTFFDCYDSIVYLSEGSLTDPTFTHIRKHGIHGLHYLFCKEKVNLQVASALQNQPAYGVIQNNLKGGLFTLMLCNGLSRAIYKPCFWPSLIAEVEANCKYMVKNKAPYQLMEQHLSKNMSHYIPAECNWISR